MCWDRFCARAGSPATIAITGCAPPGLVKRAVAALNDACRSRAFPLLVGFTLTTSDFWISGPSDATSKASVSDIIGQGVTNVLCVCVCV